MDDNVSRIREITSLTRAQIEAISGGECTPEQWVILTGELKGAYDALVDLTSYVIERVANS